MRSSSPHPLSPAARPASLLPAGLLPAGLLSGTSRPLVTLLLLLATASAFASCQTKTPVPDGINDKFMADGPIREWELRWEVESRDIFRARNAIVPHLNLRAGQTVADIGAGTGLFMRSLSEAVGPTGSLKAIDISPKFTEHLRSRAKRESLHNVDVVLSTGTSLEVPAASLDAAFLCDVYHHFEYHEAMLASIHSALRPGGQFVVIDFERIPGKTRDWLLKHVRAGKDVFRSEIEAAGFRLLEEVDVPEFRENYFLRFERI